MIFRSAQLVEVLPLRTQVLRPGFAPGRLAHFSQDECQTTLHHAAIHDGCVVAVLTLMQRSPPDTIAVPEKIISYQLRGMAVAPEWRGKEIGRSLLVDALVRFDESVLIWCNARSSAVVFYEKCGFSGVGDEFMIEGIGPHLVMYLMPCERPQSLL